MEPLSWQWSIVLGVTFIIANVGGFFLGWAARGWNDRTAWPKMTKENGYGRGVPEARLPRGPSGTTKAKRRPDLPPPPGGFSGTTK